MMRSLLTFGLLAGLLFLRPQVLTAQTAQPPSATVPPISLSFDAFLAEVAQNNLEYAAQRYNVSIAEAQVAQARVFPNPVLGADGSRDISGQNMPSILGVSLTQTFLTGGKHRAGIEVAEGNYRVAGSTVEDFFRNLRAAAANGFIDALAAQLIVQQKKLSGEALDRLVEANEKRFRVGDLAEIDLTQSRVEAQQFHSELLAAEANLQTAAIGLSQFLGKERGSVTVRPEGRLEEIPPRTFGLSELVEEALQSDPMWSAPGMPERPPGPGSNWRKPTGSRTWTSGSAPKGVSPPTIKSLPRLNSTSSVSLCRFPCLSLTPSGRNWR